MSELPEILSEMAQYASSDIAERNLRQAAIHIRSAETEIERLTAKVEAQQELVENWEKTAETYKFRLDKALRNNADLAHEKQLLNAKVEALNLELAKLESLYCATQDKNKRLLAVIDEAGHDMNCQSMIHSYRNQCDCFKSQAKEPPTND